MLLLFKMLYTTLGLGISSFFSCSFRKEFISFLSVAWHKKSWADCSDRASDDETRMTSHQTTAKSLSVSKKTHTQRSLNHRASWTLQAVRRPRAPSQEQQFDMFLPSERFSFSGAKPSNFVSDLYSPNRLKQSLHSHWQKVKKKQKRKKQMEKEWHKGIRLC